MSLDLSMPLADRHIGMVTQAASRQGGGLFEVIALQVDLLRRQGARVSVFALEDAFSAADRDRFGDARVELCRPMGPPSIGYGPELASRMLAADLDLLHLHGIWSMTSLSALQWARRTNRPLIISPHGMLDPWITARSPAKKRLARWVYEEPCWRRAYRLHALTGREQADIARETGRSDGIVIPNAAPPLFSPGNAARPPAILFISRIHSKKNLSGLIDGWALARKPEGAELIIAGWGDAADVAELEARIAAGPAGVRFVGPAFGEAKQALLTGVRFAILPSLSEGLPMAMLDAWACGLPTIMSPDCNLPEGIAAGAALACGCDAPSIAAALETALAMAPERWQAMSHAAMALADGPFSLRAVSDAWCAAYAEAIDASPAVSATAIPTHPARQAEHVRA
ncbi:MAG TPA: glycosyltransferase [Novosphingobium sp.]|nr:glycosyltransferase [Novosphingobium sp.]